MPTRKDSLGGRNDASSVAWATHGGSVAAWIAGPAALLRRFSLAAWRGLACASVALPDQIPVSIVGSACFHVSRVLYIVFFTGVARLSCTPAPRSTSVLGRSTFSASTSLPAVSADLTLSLALFLPPGWVVTVWLVSRSSLLCAVYRFFSVVVAQLMSFLFPL